MGSGNKTQTVGYRYSMGLHFGICHGPIDRLRRILVGDRRAWAGAATSNTALSVNAPQLFGGDEREGGIVGQAHVMMGGSSQTLPGAVASMLPSPAPAFRGIFSLLYSGQISANNPYVKPFAFKVQRTLAGWHGGTAWYPEKCEIGSLTPGASAKTLIQTYFTTGSGATNPWDNIAQHDVSVSGSTDAVVDGVGLVVQTDTSGDFKLVAYEGPPPNGTDALTFEGFVTLVSSPSTSYQRIARIVINEGGFDVGIHGGTRAVFNALGAFGIEYGEAGTGIEWGVERAHWCVQITSGGVFFHINGQHLYTYESVFTPNALNGVRAEIGGDGYTGLAELRYTVDSFRVRNEEVYGEANFTPPSVLPPPDGGEDDSGDVLMNPAHIIYQCVTDPQWGMGYPVQAIDTDSFAAAADTLYAEGFGLCMLWNRQEELGAFIRTVLDHIGAVFYSDPKTGKFGLRLLRADYDANELPVFDESNIVALESFQRVGYGDTVNEVTVVFRDVATNKDTPLTVQNLANVQAQGAVVSQTRQYPGIPTAALALRVAQRDLIASSTPLAKARLTVDRTAWDLFPGDVFKLSWPKLGLTSIVFRVLGIDYGTLDDGTITVDVAEDVFGLPANSYAAQEPSGWTEPDTAPAQIVDQSIMEIPYRTLAGALTAGELALLDSDAAYLSALAARPSNTAIGFEILSRVGAANFQSAGQGSFVPYAELAADIDPVAASIALDAAIDLSTVEVGSLAVVGEGQSAEIVKVLSIDAEAPSMDVARGILDTVPAAHDAGAPVWFDDGSAAPEQIERATGEEVDFKLLTLATGGKISSASTVSATAARRQFRPYAPGDFKINGQAHPDPLSGAITITWAHRDRLQQTANYIEQDDGNIGPEAGTTYSVELRRMDTNTVLASAAGLTGTSFTPTINQAGTYPMRVQVWSVRGGVESWQRHSHTFTYTGTGLSITAPGATMTVAASLVFPGAGVSITMETTQAPIQARAASGWNSRVFTQYMGPPSQVLQTGSVLTLYFTRYYFVDGQPFGEGETISFQMGEPTTIHGALNILRLLINNSDILMSYGWSVYLVDDQFDGLEPYLMLLGPVGQNWHVEPQPAYPSPASARWGTQQTIFDRGGPAIPDDIPQVVDATISGTPAAGDIITMTLGAAQFVYVVDIGVNTAALLAAALAARIEAHPSFVASADGAVITISGFGTYPFPYSVSASGARAYGDSASGVGLSLNFDGTHGSTTLVDGSPFAHAVSAQGNAQLTTADKASGTAALTLDGTGDWARIPNHPVFRLSGNVPFTIHGYVRMKSLSFSGSANETAILALWDGSASWWFGVNVSGKVVFYRLYLGANYDFSHQSTAAVTVDAWTHAAVTYDGSALRLFVGGSKQYEQTVSLDIIDITDPSKYLAIGAAVGGSANAMNGLIDRLQFIKGSALWTDDFTPPTAPL